MNDDMFLQFQREMRQKRYQEDKLREEKRLDNMKSKKWKSIGKRRKIKNRIQKVSRRKNR